jgi:hypothetical protein
MFNPDSYIQDSEHVKISLKDLLTTYQCIINFPLHSKFYKFLTKYKAFKNLQKSKISRDLKPWTKLCSYEEHVPFFHLHPDKVLGAAAPLLECRMECPMGNVASRLLFNLGSREIGESQSRNNNVVTKEYLSGNGKCDRQLAVKFIPFCVTEIVLLIPAREDLCSRNC